jgi:hypothetical protein
MKMSRPRSPFSLVRTTPFGSGLFGSHLAYAYAKQNYWVLVGICAGQILKVQNGSKSYSTVAMVVVRILQRLVWQYSARR